MSNKLLDCNMLFFFVGKADTDQQFKLQVTPFI